MKVAFTSTEQFLKELELEREHVRDNILRVTCEYTPAHRAPNVFLVTVVAGVIVRNTLVELRDFCGDMLHLPDCRVNKAQQRAEAIVEQITRYAHGVELHVRSGMYEA